MNKEELKKYKKKYYEEHREERKELQKKYNEEHKEEIKVQKKKYYEEHKEEQKEKWKKYCEEHKEERKEYMKKYYEEHKEEQKKYREKIGWYYFKLNSWKSQGINITYPEYCILWIKQDRGCKICWKPLRLWYREGISPAKYKKLQTASVDHDHRTGKVRGLLCNDCNFTLGHMERRKINGLWFINALDYLIQYNSIDPHLYKKELIELQKRLSIFVREDYKINQLTGDLINE